MCQLIVTGAFIAVFTFVESVRVWTRQSPWLYIVALVVCLVSYNSAPFSDSDSSGDWITIESPLASSCVYVFKLLLQLLFQYRNTSILFSTKQIRATTTVCRELTLIVLLKVCMITLACCEGVRRKTPLNFIFLGLFTGLCFFPNSTWLSYAAYLIWSVKMRTQGQSFLSYHKS